MPPYPSLLDSGTLRTAFGEFIVDIFTLGNQEIIVLRTPNIGTTFDTIPICRIQSECIGHMFQDQTCDCADQLHASLAKIADSGHGLLIYLRQEGMDLGIKARLGNSNDDARSYVKTRMILAQYQIRSVRLLSVNVKRIEELSQDNLSIAEFEYPWPRGKTLILGPRISRVIRQVKDGASYSLVPEPKSSKGQRILILGDLNVDFPLSLPTLESQPTPAGTGLNAARAFKEAGEIIPVVFGRVGNDANGELIQAALAEEGIYSFLGISNDKATGTVRHAMGQQGQRVYLWEKKNNANDYDLQNLRDVVGLIRLGTEDYALVISYLFVQKSYNGFQINQVLKALADSGVSIILDVTRWSVDPAVYKEMTGRHFATGELRKMLVECLAGIKLFCVIGESQTFFNLQLTPSNSPDKTSMSAVLQFFQAKWAVLRYSEGGVLTQEIGRRSDDVNGSRIPLPVSPYLEANHTSTIGLGDRMFVQGLKQILNYEKRM